MEKPSLKDIYFSVEIPQTIQLLNIEINSRESLFEGMHVHVSFYK